MNATPGPLLGYERPGVQLRLIDHLVNPTVRTILRSPFHRLMSKNVLLLTYTRHDGTQRTLPVQYRQAGDELVVQARLPEQKRWWRAMREPTKVEVRLRGSSRRGTAKAEVSPDGAVTVRIRLAVLAVP